MFPLKPYNNFKPTSNWNTYWYAQNVFNDQMINDLTQMVESNYKFEKGRTGTRELGTDTDSYDTNNRDIAYLEPAPHTKWLYDLLFPLVLQANQETFHFDIDIVTDPIHYVILDHQYYPLILLHNIPQKVWHFDDHAQHYNYIYHLY